MKTSHNRRQRKKLGLGEFQRFCFWARATLANPLSEVQIDALLDEFLDECIEVNGLVVVAGINEEFSACVFPSKRYASATDVHRELVRAWLEKRPEVTEIEVDPLVDARKQ